MKKIIKSKKIRLLVLILILLTGCFLVWKIFSKPQQIYYQGNNQTGKDPGSAPSEEEQKEIDEFYKACSFAKVFTDFGGSPVELGAKVMSMKCSADEQDNISKGEQVKVEIYTQDFEEGKSMFRDWLESKGLQESSILRITYTHKPR